MQTTQPAQAEDSRPNVYTPSPYDRAMQAARSPLARAALDNGVSFKDVQAYVESVCPATEGRARDLCNSAWYEAVNVPEVTVFNDSPLAAHVTGMVTDTLLEGALLRSVLAEGTIEHARLWWLGVL